jgi:hypothetical protein
VTTQWQPLRSRYWVASLSSDLEVDARKHGIGQPPPTSSRQSGFGRMMPGSPESAWSGDAFTGESGYWDVLVQRGNFRPPTGQPDGASASPSNVASTATCSRSRPGRCPEEICGERVDLGTNATALRARIFELDARTTAAELAASTSAELS